MGARLVFFSPQTVSELDRILQENKVQSVSDPLKRANLQTLSGRFVGVLACSNNRWQFDYSCWAEAFAVDGRRLSRAGKKVFSFMKRMRV